MSVTTARIFYCAAPALAVAVPLAFVHPAVGAILGMCVFGLGWDVTKERTP